MLRPIEELKAAISAGGSVMIGREVVTDHGQLEQLYEAHANQPATRVSSAAPSGDIEAFRLRNDAQADLLDVLAGSEEALARLNVEQVAAVAKFEGVDVPEGLAKKGLIEAVLKGRKAGK